MLKTLLLFGLSSIISAELADDTSLLQADQPSWGSSWRDRWANAAGAATGGKSGGSDNTGTNDAQNWADTQAKAMSAFGAGVQSAAKQADDAIRDISSNITEVFGIVKKALARFSAQNDGRKDQIIAEIDAAKTRKKKLSVYEKRLLEFMNVTGAVWDSYAFANQEMLKYMQRLDKKVHISGEFMNLFGDAIGHVSNYRDQMYRSKEQLAGISKLTDRSATLRMMTISRSLKLAASSMDGLSAKIVSYAKRQESTGVEAMKTMLGSLLPSKRIDAISGRISKVVDVTGTIGDSLVTCGQKLSSDVNAITKHIRVVLRLKKPRPQQAPKAPVKKQSARKHKKARKHTK